METIFDAKAALALNDQEFEEKLEQEPDLVNKLVDAGGSSKSSLLVEAIKARQKTKCQILVEKGVDFASQPENSVALTIGYGADNLQRGLLRFLLEKGAPFPSDPRGCKEFIYSRLATVFANFPDVLDVLMAHGFDPVACETLAQRSILAQAIRSSEVKSITKYVKAFLKLGCSQFTLPNDYEDGRSLLLEAFEYGNVPVARTLLATGCDINQPSSDGTTPLMIAIIQSNKPAIDLLLKSGAELNLKNRRGQTALDLATNKSGFKRVCAQLKKAGAKTTLELEAEENPEGQLEATLLQHIHTGEPWADQLIDHIGQQSDDIVDAWTKLIAHCSENNSSKPSKRWHKQASDWVSVIGREAFYEQLHSCLELAPEKRTHVLNLEELAERYYWMDTDGMDPSWTLEQFTRSGYRGTDLGPLISNKNTRILKGLVWLASDFTDIETTGALRKLAAAMYKKVTGVGMRNATLGNAAVYSLSCMEGDAGLKEIITLRSTIKYNPALVNINRVFHRLAKERNVDPEDLAAVAVPDFGLTDVGVYRSELGDYQVSVTLQWNGKAEILWSKKDKSQKSVPAALKSDFKDPIKKIKALAKELTAATSAHSQRIEQLYLQDHELSLAEWQDQYADHRLIGFLARRLIWQFRSPSQSVNAMYTPEGYMDSNGDLVYLDKGAQVSLWHPIASEVEEVLSWRQRLIEQEWSQPFKQAHREIYVLTQAERGTQDHSLRFANHILKHHQFHALATQRKWHQLRGGSWDGGKENSASKEVPSLGLSVRFEARGVRSYGFSEGGMYACVATSEVTFYGSKKGKINLEDVPEVAFSELMRDVDLFVGVCSIGNDPAWPNREDDYWLTSSFGDLLATAQTRKEVLEALLPKLRISSRLQIEGRFLIVEGKLSSYRIHIGSSNIQILPDNRYLCIVTKPREHVMLPFNGDHILSAVLSKAFLLANDHRIKDASITSQIHNA